MLSLAYVYWDVVLKKQKKVDNVLYEIITTR